MGDQAFPFQSASYSGTDPFVVLLHLSASAEIQPQRCKTLYFAFVHHKPLTNSSTMRFLQFSLGRKASAVNTELLLSDLTPRNSPQTVFPSDIATSDNKTTHQEIIPIPPPKPTRKFSSGWRFDVVLSIFLGSSILILNLDITIWASTRFPRDKDLATVHEDFFSKVKTTITYIHLAVNILGTFPLAPLTCVCRFVARPHVRKSMKHMQETNSWVLVYQVSKTCFMSIEKKRPMGLAPT